ncbi:MAG: RES family NAD+ phosphorylase [Acidimicrobiales bacterium]
MRGRWWRHVPADADPLARQAEAPDGRWQRGQAVEALYLADSPETAWAEWYRALAELAVPPHRALPRDLWRFALDVELADLSSAQQLRRVGLAVPRPSRAEWPSFQAVGERLCRDGWPGLVAPSAARPGHLVVCLFRSGARILGVRRVTPPRRVGTPPIPPRGMTT